MGNPKVVKKTDVLSASEIGQYSFCSCSWWLQRCGYEPESPSLEAGKQIHVTLGDTMDRFEAMIRSARWLTTLGLLIVGVALILLLFGVIL